MSAEVAHVEFMDANGATIDTLPPGLQRIQGVWAKQVGDQVTLLLRLAVRPGPAELRRRARQAAARLLQLYGPDQK